MDMNSFNKGTTNPAPFDAGDIQKNKLMAVLCYLGILMIVPALAAKDSKFVRFHLNQGLVLFGTTIAYNFTAAVLGNVLMGISPLFAIFSLGLSCFGFVFFALLIIGLVNAARGEAKALPLIGGLHLLK